MQKSNPGHLGVSPYNLHFPYSPSLLKHAYKTSPGHGSHLFLTNPGLTENAIASFGSPPSQPSLFPPLLVHSVKVIGENSLFVVRLLPFFAQYL